MYGFVVHFKIYPIVYAPCIFFWLDHRKGIFFTRNRVRFTLIASGTFLGLLGFFYLLFGWEFIQETYLYHFLRQDSRHNYSIYFYYFYLNFSGSSLM